MWYRNYWVMLVRERKYLTGCQDSLCYIEILNSVMQFGTLRCLGPAKSTNIILESLYSVSRSEIPQNPSKFISFNGLGFLSLLFAWIKNISIFPSKPVKSYWNSLTYVLTKLQVVSKAGFILRWQMKKLKLQALSNLFSVVSAGGRSLHAIPQLWVQWPFPQIRQADLEARLLGH